MVVVAAAAADGGLMRIGAQFGGGAVMIWVAAVVYAADTSFDAETHVELVAAAADCGD